MTKTVALADDAYEALARLKKAGQSFSDVVRELTVSRRPRIRDVVPAGRDRETDDYWTRFQKKRQKARQATAARVRLGK